GTERIFPFDIIPRIVAAEEWDRIERGIRQRVHALNLFIDDIYHDQKILKDRVIPPDLILSAKSYRKACIGLNPPHRIWCHITGTDLVRDRDGEYYVLERSEEHTSELQSLAYLVCRLLLEKKNTAGRTEP